MSSEVHPSPTSVSQTKKEQPSHAGRTQAKLSVVTAPPESTPPKLPEEASTATTVIIFIGAILAAFLLIMGGYQRNLWFLAIVSVSCLMIFAVVWIVTAIRDRGRRRAKSKGGHNAPR
jgi:membrane protein YdbS with pleckstrin-like domain